MVKPAGSGYTLLECLMVMAVATLLAGLALPALLGSQRRMARLDAVRALDRVQTEQERYRANFGLYAPTLAALQGVGVISPQGRYTLSLDGQGPQTYRASAQATGGQTLDRDCPALTLDVHEGFARIGPSPACWGR